MSLVKQVKRLSAFSDTQSGGNPAGVWLGDELPDVATMQEVAARIGYSETAFVAPTSGTDKQIRYFSPLAEVDFCGHATIATGVHLGAMQGPGDYQLQTAVGQVALKVEDVDGQLFATLTSVPTQHKAVAQVLLQEVLWMLSWERAELDPVIPPVLAFAGLWHLVIAVRSLSRLQRLDYDFEGLKVLMEGAGITTLQLLWREDEALFHSRNPFPVGGVVEDAATGAAAAALGGYLRDAGLVRTPFEFSIRQGEAMGRPSLLRVSVPPSGGIAVSGTAVEIGASTHMAVP